MLQEWIATHRKPRTSTVTDFFNESISLYLSQINLSVLYQDEKDSKFKESLEKIDKEYLSLLLAELIKISVFKPLTKKNKRSSRLLILDRLLESIEPLYAKELKRKQLNGTHSIHSWIFSLVHFDQDEILSYLFRSSFFKDYIKCLKPVYFILIDVDIEDMFTHAVCHNAIKTISVFQKFGWKISLEILKKAVEYNATKSIRYFLSGISEEEKEILASIAVRNGNVTILNMLTSGELLPYFKLLYDNIRNQEDSYKASFYSTSKIYRFTPDVALANEACQKFLDYLETISEDEVLREIKNGVKDAKEKSSPWLSQIAFSYTTPAELKELDWFYGTHSDRLQHEIDYGLRKFLIAEKIENREFKVKKSNLPFPDCKRPKDFYSFKEMVGIIMEDFLAPQSFEELNLCEARDGHKYGILGAGRTIVGYNRYGQIFPYIEAMLNTSAADVIQSDCGYRLLHNGKIIAEVLFYVINQPISLNFLKKKLSSATLEKAEIIHNEIYKLDSKSLLRDITPLRNKVIKLLSLIDMHPSQYDWVDGEMLKKTKKTVEELNEIGYQDDFIKKWLALLFRHHKLPLKYLV